MGRANEPIAYLSLLIRAHSRGGRIYRLHLWQRRYMRPFVSLLAAAGQKLILEIYIYFGGGQTAKFDGVPGRIFVAQEHRSVICVYI